MKTARIKTKAISTILALCLMLSAAPTASLAVFRDSGDIIAPEEAVAEFYGCGVIQGYPDGSFKPDQLLTLAEGVAIIARVFGFKRTGEHEYPEVSRHWAYGYYVACIDNGLSELIPAIKAGGWKSPISTGLWADTISSVLSGRYGIQPDLGSGFGTELLTRGNAVSILYKAFTIPFGSKDVTALDLLKAQAVMSSGKLLRYFTLAGYYEDDMINAVKLVDKPAAYVYDSEYHGFIPAEATPENIIYSYVAIYSVAGGATGDTLFIVGRDDSGELWDDDAIYEDEDGLNVFGNEYNIPFGERLIGHEGIFDGAVVDYLNLASPGDLSGATYYYTYDWYNSTSTDTLTMLTGFRTIQQTTGWTCGLTSAVMAMDWFDMRGGLNELDLAALRNTKEKYGAYRWGSATDVKMLVNVFEAINDMEGREVWKWDSTYDFIDEDGELSEDYLSPEWIIGMLEQGRPVLVGWNSFGGHWQVIIGYDTMGTDDTADDVLILADPYDTTDHLNDGVNIQSYERLYWDWSQDFDRDFGRSKDYGMTVIFAPYPADYDPEAYECVMGDGLAYNKPAPERTVNESEDMLIPYGATAADLKASDYSYTKAEIGDNGFAGAASSNYYRQSQHIGSRYYPQLDFYKGAKGVSDTLVLLDGFKTSQQASEWTCGPSSLRMVLNWFGLMGDETEFSLAHLREDDIEGATTLDGMVQIFDALSAGFGYLTTDDLDDDDCIGGYCLYDGLSDEGLIPFCLKNGIPILIGWDEWGGHWQVIIGYDDMGTEDTQDDVLILADPYDTTDHLQDGYVIESFERLVYGWGAAFDERGYAVFVIAAPDALMAEAFG